MLDPYVVFTLRLNVKYGHGLVADLPEDQMTAQPVPGRTLNHAAWVLGHMVMGNVFALSLVGEAYAVPDTWPQLFGMDSQPTNGPYPSKDELLRHFSASSEQLAEALGRVSAEQLARPMQGPMAALFPTVGDFLVFEVTSHLGTHLGQLSTWRRALGYKRLF